MRIGIKPLLIIPLLLIRTNLTASEPSEWEHDLRGIVDLRATFTDSFQSYPSGGTGRFRFSDGTSFTLSQASLKYTGTYDLWSIHAIGTAYSDNENDAVGITEAFVRYRGIPNQAGWRQQFRGGIIYPSISLENIATAWVSPYTLSFSTQNTWIAEEVRHAGLEWSIDRLGRVSNSKHDFNLTLSAYKYNDPTGALLAWHGWTQSSRQSIWNEKLPFPMVPAMQPGNLLEPQAIESDPFTELDSRFGFHLKMDWRWDKKLRLRLGHYDNQAKDNVVINGQYSWRTKFSHLGLEWRFNRETILISQYMHGDTRMRVANDFDVVGLDFTNSFVLLSHSITPHRYSVRYEQFNNEDFDQIWGDNNDDQGDGITLSYQYSLGGGAFLMLEYQQVNSIRPANRYQNQPISNKESQWQIGLRYFY